MNVEPVYDNADIIQKDDNGIKEELGDILLHVIFYSVIASENKKFKLLDVISNQTKKLIERHPHIYSNVKVQNV